MECETRRENGATVVSIRGRMDATTSPEIEGKLDGLVAGGETRLVVDLKGLEYISSAGLRGLLATAKKLKATQGEMSFANLDGHVRDVFNISGFCSIFKVFDSVEAALKQAET
jgi:anti-anti-sigma factor